MRFVRILLVISILALVASSPAQTSRVDRLIEQSRMQTLRGEWDQAAASLKSAIATAVKSRDQLHEARFRTEYARVLMDRNFFHRQDRESAFEAINEAESAAQRANDSESLSDLVQYRGQIHYSQAFTNGDFETPRKYFEQALNGREKKGDLRRLAESSFYVGVTYEQENRLKEAIPYYRKSLAYSEKAGDKVWQSYAHRHLGGAEEEAGHLNAAYDHIQREIVLRREGGFTVGVPFAMLHLADFMAKRKGEMDRAIKLTEDAIDLAEKSNSLHAQFLAQLALSKLELERKRPEAALSYATCAMDGAHAFGEPRDIKQVEQQLAEIRSKI